MAQGQMRSRGGARTFIPAIVVGLGAVALMAASSKAQERRRSRPPDDAPLRASRHDRVGDYAVVGKSVLINKPRHELFAFWRDFQNLPRFMSNVKAIGDAGDGRLRWTVAAPASQTVELLTEVDAERENEFIAWRSVEGSQIETWGHVSFRDAPAGRGTVVAAEIAYKPPGGDLGRLLAKSFLAEPNIQGRHELKRFKMLMETGEIATSARRRSET
jgi:uncharacterized membrane protein